MPPLSVEQAFQIACQHHQAGRLAQAEALCWRILQHDPDHADILHLLGIMAQQRGQHDSAAELLGRAVAIKPDYPEAYSNLGMALKNCGRLDEAIAAYRRAIALKPHLPETHYNLGNALRDKGRLDEAAGAYRQAIALQPDFAQARHNLDQALQNRGPLDQAAASGQASALPPNDPEACYNLANALNDQGQLDAAIAAYRQAIALQPGFAQAHNNLGNALRRQGRLDEAIAACQRCIALQPAFPQAHYNLGNAWKDLGQFDQALAAYRQAIALQPGFAEAHNNLGNALRQQGQPEAAQAAYRRAIALQPAYPEAHYNLGNALRQQGQLEAAVAAYRQAIALQPGYPAAYNNLGAALKDLWQLDAAIAAYRHAIALQPTLADAHNNLGAALKDQGQIEEALAAFRQAAALAPDHAVFHGNLVYTLHFHPAGDAPAIAGELRRWNLRHAEPLRQFIVPHANDRDPERRLRIGYVSADFREHASAFFLLPLLAAHDHRDCEVFCFAQVARPDHLTARMRALADHWRDTVGLADEALAALIQRDRIDILVDLKLHTENNRLPAFARKPAPVQATWLGYPGSTGLNTIDYRLSDPRLDPPGGDESVYSERTIRLPDCFWCYDPLDARAIPCGALPALTRGCVTFGCLNNFCKVNDGVLRLWARVLLAAPSSRLLLLAPEGDARPRTLKVLEQEGVAPERIEFAPYQRRGAYLRTYHRIDLGLDSFPCNGHTTSLDSLWMGVPFVTLAGQTAMGRAGWSVLSQVGLGELAARSHEEYVRIARELAGDLARLGAMRGALRHSMAQSPLMDGPRFARNLEAAFRQMWRQWCATA